MILVRGAAVRVVSTSPAVPRPDSWTGDTFQVDALLWRPAAPVSEPPPSEGATGDPGPSHHTATSPRLRSRAPRGAAHRAQAEAARARAAGSSEQSVTFGAEGGPEGIRSLARAFTRAVPPATSLDPAWRELPLGRAGVVRVEVTVEHGKLDGVKGLDQAPAHLRRLVERTLRLIEKGRFALYLSDADSGREVLLISASISARGNQLADSDYVMELGSEGPTRERPGRAFFTLASGRHVEVTVRVLTGTEL